MVDPTFFIPFSNEELKTLFDENEVIMDGAYIDGNLVGIMMLFVRQETLVEIKKDMNLDNYKVAELGGAMVLPEACNKGIAYQMEKKLINDAKKMGFDYVVATVHPNNIASQTTVKKLGMNQICNRTVLDNYPRDFYQIKL